MTQTKAMVLLTKSYGFVQQKLWFCSAKAMVLLSKSYGFVQQKLWFCSAKVPSPQNYNKAGEPPNDSPAIC